MNKVAPGTFTFRKSAALIPRIIPLAKTLAKKSPTIFGEASAAGQGASKAIKPKAPVVPGSPRPSAGAESRSGFKMPTLKPRPAQAKPVQGSLLSGQRPMLGNGQAAPISMQRQPELFQSHGAALTGGNLPPVINPTLTGQAMPKPQVLPTGGLQGLPVGFKGTFGKGAASNPFSKVAALARLSPLARVIGNMPAKGFRF